MLIRVGGRELITTATLLVPQGEDAWIEFEAGSWKVKLNVVFIEDKEDTTPAFTLSGKGEHAQLAIKNWNNPLPGAVPQPFSFGETDGRSVVFLFSGYGVNGFKRIDISFFWEKHDG